MAAGSEQTLELIGQFYDAAFDAALWPGALTRLTDAVGGAQVCMFDYGLRTEFSGLVAPRHDPDYVSLHDEWVQHRLRTNSDVLWQRMLAAPAGQVLEADQLTTCDAFTRSEFYNEWWRPQGLSLETISMKWLTDAGWGFICVHRPARAGAFDAEERRLFGLVMPHVVRAAGLGRRIRQTRLEEEAALCFLERIGLGAIMVDAEARVVHLNEVASELLIEGDGLRADGSVVAAADASAAAVLRRLVAGCAERRLNGSSRGGSLTAPRAERPSLQVEIVPVSSESLRHCDAAIGMQRPVAVLIVTDPERERQRLKARLQERFGLTPAEADVALEISKGDGRKAAAARLGVSPGTVRIHLQHVFDKTGTHRQAELVRVLVEAGGPARWESRFM